MFVIKKEDKNDSNVLSVSVRLMWLKCCFDVVFFSLCVYYFLVLVDVLNIRF